MFHNSVSMIFSFHYELFTVVLLHRTRILIPCIVICKIPWEKNFDCVDVDWQAFKPSTVVNAFYLQFTKCCFVRKL